MEITPKRKLSIVAFASITALAIATGSMFAGSAQSAYVTTDQECDQPIDLQVNQLEDLGDAYVWLKKVSGSQVEDDLVWSLWQGGEQVGSGSFAFICTTTNGKYTLADPGFGSGGAGTYTLKVDWDNGTNYSGDSFSVE